MRLKGQAYSDRLEAYSHSTLQLIADLDTISREVTYSKTAQRAKEILFDDEGNKISRKYSRELSFVDYANEATANEEREQLTNRMLLARPLESTATEDRKVLCIHSLQRRAKYESGIDQTKRNPHR